MPRPDSGSVHLAEARWTPTLDEGRYRRLLHVLFDRVAQELDADDREAG